MILPTHGGGGLGISSSGDSLGSFKPRSSRRPVLKEVPFWLGENVQVPMIIEGLFIDEVEVTEAGGSSDSEAEGYS